MIKNLILIGMPGCGKSTTGVLVAKALCKSFIDTDLLIQTSEGCTLQSIIEQKGNDYFAALEEKILLGVNEESSVISTGGSAVYYDSAMNHFKEIGTVVYMKISFEQMMKRITNMKTRGILLKNGETIETMFHRREALYEKYADIIIDCNDSTIEDTVEKLCNICDV